MGFQEGFREIARKETLGTEAMKVFLFILGSLEYSNQVMVRQVDIARELGMKKQNVYRAIKTLIKEEVLVIEDPIFKRKGPLRLNHKYAWKGKLKQLGLLPQPLEDGKKQEPGKKSRRRNKPKDD
jgi:phage regulator Rha-like protein